MSTRRPWVRTALPLLVGLGGGALVAVLLFDSGTDGPAQLGNTPVLPGTAAADIEVAPGDGADQPILDAAEATTPEQAVSSFLAAEIARDFETSHTYLSSGDLRTNSTPALWRAAHRQIPPIVGFEVTGTSGDGQDTVVETALALDSSLDPVIGLVPARATATWELEQVDDGSWRVQYADSELTPQFPEPESAVPAATAWAEAIVAGDDPGDLQGVRRLYGAPVLADELADASGPVQTGAVALLPPTGGSSDLIAQFGGAVVGWARVVPMTSPVELAIVLAPVDDAWVVIGILRPEAVR